MSYTITRDPGTGVVRGATAQDGRQIPVDPANRDWQDVVAWAAAQDPPVSLEATGPTLAAARAQRLADLDAWYAQQVASGVTVEGVLLDATIEAQNRFDAFATTVLAGIQVGVMTGLTEVTLYAADGSPVTLQAGQALGLLLGYGQALQVLAGSYSACKAAVLAAVTPEDVLAVELPD